jgi:acetyl esterase/lipase
MMIRKLIFPLLLAPLCCSSWPLLAAQSASATTAPPAATAPPTPILLWPNGAPGAVGDTDLDKPSITPYLPAQNPTRTAVIVCPGGGYQHLSMTNEGSLIAQWLNERGVAAFVLVYRLGPRYRNPAPLLDAQRAIRYVRAHAAEDGVDVNHIGIWGFSAGGHLASTAGTHFDAGNPAAADPIERMSSRPDFMVLAYPVISMQPGIAHAGSLHMLLGDSPNPILEDELSTETQVTPQTPPAFIYATTTDQTVPVMNSVLFYEACLRAGVPAELHIFEQGRHGSGLGQHSPQLSMWPVLLQNWMNLHGWMAQTAH